MERSVTGRFRRPAAVAGNHNEDAGSSFALAQMNYGLAIAVRLMRCRGVSGTPWLDARSWGTDDLRVRHPAAQEGASPVAPAANAAG